jgi:hypothetical protein
MRPGCGGGALSLGAAKNGALACEAVIFFDPDRASAFPCRRKRAGRTLSKGRLLGAQMEAYPTDGLWLDLARRIAAAIVREDSARRGAVREFGSMIDTQSAARPPRRLAYLAAAVGVLLALSPAAKAQGLFSLFGGGPSSEEIERRLEASGYELTHPLVRRGDVYLADVAVGRDGVERLVIDAESGRIVQRFHAGWARWGDAAPRPWYPEQSDSWNSPPRPPADVDRGAPGDALDLPGARREPRAPTGGRFARGDDAPAPAVVLGRDGARATSPDPLEKPKPKSSEAKRKPAPAVKAATLTPPEANGAPAAKPLPEAAAADAPGNVAAAGSPPPEAPAPPAPTKSKAVNDLPVTPLD